MNLTAPPGAATPAPPAARLRAERVTKRFGGLVAVDRVTLGVEPGAILGVIGPNGSGKSTFLNCLGGLLPFEGGQVFYGDREITGLSPHTVARLGISRTFQVPRVFLDMTLLENMLAPVLHVPEPRRALEDKAHHLLARFELETLAGNLARELSGGQQKLLEFVRALMLDPAVLLLDEPFAGVHNVLKERMVQGIAEQNRAGRSVLIVSHDMPSLYLMTQHIICFHQGAVIATGTPRELQANEHVVEAYFGG